MSIASQYDAIIATGLLDSDSLQMLRVLRDKHIRCKAMLLAYEMQAQRPVTVNVYQDGKPEVSGLTEPIPYAPIL